MASSSFNLDSLGEHPTLFSARDEGIIFEAGEKVADRFQVVRPVGGGGMGIVYEVKDGLMDNQVKALKVIIPSLVKSERSHDRFVQEARIAQQLAHPNIVNTFDLDEHAGVHFITMELLEGRSLADAIKDHKRLSLAMTVEVARQVLRGLTYAHRTTIHRDIKPQNIFLCNDGAVKLLDFGLARIVGSNRFTESSMAIGTAAYMAPEQLEGHEATAASDLYSVGVVMYQCATGRLPLGRFKLPSEIDPALPEWFDELLESLLAPSPGDRAQDAVAIRRMLNQRGREIAEEHKKAEAEAAERRRIEEEQARKENDRRERRAKVQQAKKDAEKLGQELDPETQRHAAELIAEGNAAWNAAQRKGEEEEEAAELYRQCAEAYREALNLAEARRQAQAEARRRHKKREEAARKAKERREQWERADQAARKAKELRAALTREEKDCAREELRRGDDKARQAKEAGEDYLRIEQLFLEAASAYGAVKRLAAQRRRPTGTPPKSIQTPEPEVVSVDAGLAPAPPRKRRRKGFLAAVLAILVLFLLGGAAASFWYASQRDDRESALLSAKAAAEVARSDAQNSRAGQWAPTELDTAEQRMAEAAATADPKSAASHYQKAAEAFKHAAARARERFEQAKAERAQVRANALAVRQRIGQDERQHAWAEVQAGDQAWLEAERNTTDYAKAGTLYDAASNRYDEALQRTAEWRRQAQARVDEARRQAESARDRIPPSLVRLVGDEINAARGLFQAAEEDRTDRDAAERQYNAAEQQYAEAREKALDLQAKADASAARDKAENERANLSAWQRKNLEDRIEEAAGLLAIGNESWRAANALMKDRKLGYEKYTEAKQNFDRAQEILDGLPEEPKEWESKEDLKAKADAEAARDHAEKAQEKLGQWQQNSFEQEIRKADELLAEAKGYFENGEGLMRNKGSARGEFVKAQRAFNRACKIFEDIPQPTKPKKGEIRTFPLNEQGFGIRMVYLDPGEFPMGSPKNEPGRKDEGEDLHTEAIERGFWLGLYEVTQAQWRAVLGKNPTPADRPDPLREHEYPVTHISAKDVDDFLEELREIDPRFRLPTEKEWEYACRAGKTNAFSTGDKLDPEMANFKHKYWNGNSHVDSNGIVESVSKYPPNDWGLYNMHGNVAEWCANLYEKSAFRVHRGGSYLTEARECRCAARGRNDPYEAKTDVGFRLLREE